MLMETVKAAEGRTDVDNVMMSELADEPAPADIELQSPTTAAGPIFGIPEPDDPDPFGVLALEQAGLEIREAGTKSRPASTQFEYNPSPTSPIYSKFHRRSMDTLATKSNRESYMSTRSTLRTSTDRATQTTEMGTQTDDALLTPNTSPSHSDENKRIIEEDEKPAVEPEEIDYTKIDLGPYSSMNRSEEFDGTTVNNDSPRERDEHHITSADTSYTSDDEDDEEEPVIFEAASAQATIITPQAVSARGVGLVNIPKRPPPPPLPPRNMARSKMVDQASGGSTPTTPSKSGFEEVDLHGTDRKSNEVEAPKRKSLEEQVEALKEQNLDDSTPNVHDDGARDVLKHGIAASTGLKVKDEDETEDFHSVPTTPNERPIEVN